MILLFLGPPGSGKDTQASILADKYGFGVVSPGEALREEVEKGSEAGKLAQPFMERGDLVPDDVLDQVLRSYIKKFPEPKLIITGSPRRLPQVELTDKLIADLGQQIKAAIYFHLDDAEIVKRLSGRLYAPKSNRTYHEVYNPPKVPGKCDVTGEDLIRRPDDEPAAVTERLEVYHHETRPVVDAYRRRGILMDLDASLGIVEVTKNLERELELIKV